MPFPTTPYASVLIDDTQMMAAVAGALSEAIGRFPVLGGTMPPISMVLVDESTSPPTFRHGGMAYRAMHYSGSLLKMAAMYAAFELRYRVNVRAAGGDATAGNLFDILKNEFDPVIDAAVPRVNAEAAVTPAMRVPNYRAIFAAIPLTTGGVAAEFAAAFRNNLVAMIVDSNNNAAGAVVQALGYSYINGALEAGGFFRSAFPPNGVWLGGTFVGLRPPVRVDTENDGDSAQATTCSDMANLCAHIVQRTLVSAEASAQMNKLWYDAAHGIDASFIDHERRALSTRSYSVTHTKVGLGPLKTGATVASDATLLVHVPTERKFLTVWQNAPGNDSGFNAMSFIVDRAIELYG